MKRKGITIWEQHIERFVLGAAALFFVVFAALQIISQPNAGTLQGEPVGPGDVDRLLIDKAETIRAQLTDDARPAVDIPDHRPVLETFHASISGAISPETVAFPGPTIAPRGPGIGGGTGTGDQAYVVPVLAAAHSVVAEQQFDGVDPEFRSGVPELEQRFPETPYDVTWIIPACVFDLANVREQFRKPGPNGELSIPSNWHDNRIEVFDVKVEREELVDGQWTNRIVLAVPPAMDTVRPLLEQENPDKGTRTAIRERLDQPGMREAIVHPPFYPTVNSSATPPDPRLEIEEPEEPEEIDGGDEDTTDYRIRRIEGKRTKAIRNRDSVIERILGLGGSPAPEGSEPEKPGPEKRKPGGGGKTAPGGGGRQAPGGGIGSPSGGGRRGQEEEQRKMEKNEKAIEGLQRQLRSLRRQIAEYERQIKALRPDVELDQPEEPAASVPWWEQAEVLLWAHDIDIEPGKSYRYRFTVELYNPFFARRLDLREDQHDLAGPITLASETSEWSEPVEVIPASRVFITRASPRGQEVIGGRSRAAQATVEVYRFFDGRWWLDTSRVEIGERVGGEQSVPGSAGDGADEQTIDFGTRWFVLDIIENLDAAARDIERGLGATVLLQNLDDPELSVLFDPQAMLNDAERRRLRNAVEAAEDAMGSMASAGP